MRKPLPKFSPPELKKEDFTCLKSESRAFECELITHLFGGGVEAGQIDKDMPIRATTIRGQLRFWWRIAYKKKYSANLFKAEMDLWGGSDDMGTLTASKVLVRVSLNSRDIPINKDKIERCAEYKKKSDGNFKSFPENWVGGAEAGGYSLFPGKGKVLNGVIEKHPSDLLKPGIKWNLMITFSDDSIGQEGIDEVVTAIKWWATFGSVGSRGRRGLGAITVKAVGPTEENKATNPDSKSPLIRLQKKEVSEAGYKMVIQNRKKTHKNAADAWKDGIKALHTFRQGLNFARNSAPNSKPGRSFWPEPDAIRKITACSADKHKPIEPVKEFFPRACFGLPIIFQFKDKDQGDPENTTLKPENAERMASPIIIRPYSLDDYGTEWACSALYLGTELPKIKIKVDMKNNNIEKPVNYFPNDNVLINKLMDSIKPLQAVRVKLENTDFPDPIQVFLEFFEDPSRFLENQ